MPTNSTTRTAIAPPLAASSNMTAIRDAERNSNRNVSPYSTYSSPSQRLTSMMSKSMLPDDLLSLLPFFSPPYKISILSPFQLREPYPQPPDLHSAIANWDDGQFSTFEHDNDHFSSFADNDRFTLIFNERSSSSSSEQHISSEVASIADIESENNNPNMCRCAKKQVSAHCLPQGSKEMIERLPIPNFGLMSNHFLRPFLLPFHSPCKRFNIKEGGESTVRDAAGEMGRVAAPSLLVASSA
ncbi:uncharacterized protein MYCGRDRAFT_98036 [Zymoseptoria tritici IPO323]|uniref:Uncharacterized protein n=1 Tax=Zymoseptoria tritici (strain CBS 115943 / IPO323) TaxID=336722 RepID=F9XS47_ZYMTI|nr:uncharacterized protein MYCGRDRAFT_98036 [Zymoseptoria tritici IPO323]EGP81904.1 hypothetical protein MYCGRDRAFT_98036 [Zymoseptoria tritici IPO323]